MLVIMKELEFRNVGERSRLQDTRGLLILGLAVLTLALLAVVVLSGTSGQVDVSIPTRLFPGT